MAEAGYADGFSIDLITSEMTDYSANYEVLQAELAEIGITINLSVVDHATMHEQIREDVNPIVIYVAYRPNADVYLTNFFHSDSIVVEGASPITNFSHYSGADDLIEQARAETDPAAQEELWKQANIQIQKDLAAIPLYRQHLVFAGAWRRLRTRAGVQSRPLSADHRADDRGAVAPELEAPAGSARNARSRRSRGTRAVPLASRPREWLELRHCSPGIACRR